MAVEEADCSEYGAENWGRFGLFVDTEGHTDTINQGPSVGPVVVRLARISRAVRSFRWWFTSSLASAAWGPGKFGAGGGNRAGSRHPENNFFAIGKK